MSPDLWASVPYGNATAFVDFAGSLELWFHALAGHVFTELGASFTVYPLGSPDTSEWPEAVQAQFEAAAIAIGLPPPVDLASYNLDREEDHASFFFVLSLEARALQQASGLP